jgi:hypothetical protein
MLAAESRRLSDEPRHHGCAGAWISWTMSAIADLELARLKGMPFVQPLNRLRHGDQVFPLIQGRFPP